MTKCIRPEKSNWRDNSDEDTRQYCYTCLRPKRVCLCHSIHVENNPCTIGILQHPNEKGKTFNTAKIAELSLKNSFLYTGVNFDDDEIFNAKLSEFNIENVGVLYPSESAIDLSLAPKELECLFVVDGTWPEAKKILNKTTCFNSIQHYAFTPKAISNYSLRKEPDVNYVCSLEAIVESLRILEKDRNRYGGLLDTLSEMIRIQESFRYSNSRHKSSSEYTKIKRRIKEINRLIYSSNIEDVDTKPFLKELQLLKSKID